MIKNASKEKNREERTTENECDHFSFIFVLMVLQWVGVRMLRKHFKKCLNYGD